MSPKAFAHSIGVSPKTVAFWRGRLGDVSNTPRREPPRLVQVEIASQSHTLIDDPQRWELRFDQGVTLRAHSAVPTEVLRVVLAHLAPGTRA
jgi:hypothetical protein